MAIIVAAAIVLTAVRNDNGLGGGLMITLVLTVSGRRLESYRDTSRKMADRPSPGS
jgi:hypothetical protein